MKKALSKYISILKQCPEDQSNIHKPQRATHLENNSCAIFPVYKVPPNSRDDWGITLIQLFMQTAAKTPWGPEAEQTEAHEGTHALESLFNTVYEIYGNDFIPEENAQRYTLEFVKFATTEEDRAFRLKKLLEQEMYNGANDAKGEILAYFLDGSTQAQIHHNLTESEESGGLYDYFSAPWREQKTEDTVKKLGTDQQELVERLVNEVFIKEYEDLLQKTIPIPFRLVEEGLPGLRVFSLLSHKYLQHWPKTADRITENRRRLTSNTPQ